MSYALTMRRLSLTRNVIGASSHLENETTGNDDVMSSSQPRGQTIGAPARYESYFTARDQALCACARYRKCPATVRLSSACERM